MSYCSFDFRLTTFRPASILCIGKKGSGLVQCRLGPGAPDCLPRLRAWAHSSPLHFTDKIPPSPAVKSNITPKELIEIRNHAVVTILRASPIAGEAWRTNTQWGHQNMDLNYSTGNPAIPCKEARPRTAMHRNSAGVLLPLFRLTSHYPVGHSACMCPDMYGDDGQPLQHLHVDRQQVPKRQWGFGCLNSTFRAQENYSRDVNVSDATNQTEPVCCITRRTLHYRFVRRHESDSSTEKLPSFARVFAEGSNNRAESSSFQG